MTGSSAAAPLALYIHWPFCKKKCPYCDFNSHVREKVEFEAWQHALLCELAYMHQLAPSRRLQSIFFGGGTPSLMPPFIAQALISQAKAYWPNDDDMEVTLEANPTSVEADTFARFIEAGINRLSLGVQSFDAAALKFLGREHSAQEAKAAIARARAAGVPYSFDLIYARPGQTLLQWQQELDEALMLAGSHLSLYQLTIEENTAFHTAYTKGEFVMPSDDLAALLYDATTQRLQQAGYEAYEVSNYAMPGAASRHNLAYWRGYEYMGIGPGAHGRLAISDGWHATLTLKSPERWLEHVGRYGHGLESITPLSPRQRAEERVMMGLRLSEGMVCNEEVEPWLDIARMMSLESHGLLRRQGNRLIATDKGRLVLTSLSAQVLKNS